MKYMLLKFYQAQNGIHQILKHFSPNLYEDITNYIEIKKQVLKVYSQEMRPPPHSRCIDNVLRLNAMGVTQLVSIMQRLLALFEY